MYCLYFGRACRTVYSRRHMEADQLMPKPKSGQQLINAERMVVIAKLVEALSNGYMSTYALSKQLKLSKDVIATYRPLADKLISENSFDRNVVRNLQVKRVYQLIEYLIQDLKGAKGIKEKVMIHGAIYKHSSHLALITGLNVETHVNIDPTKLVIIRSNQRRNKDRTIEVDSTVDNAVQASINTVDKQ